MRKLVITQNITLDGSIEMLGDWFDPQLQDHDLLEESHRQDHEADALLVGRRTLEDFRSYWPTQVDDPTGVSEYLNKVAKYVVSSTMTNPEWANSTVLAGDPVDHVRDIKAQPGKDIVLLAASASRIRSSPRASSTSIGCSSTPSYRAAAVGCSRTRRRFPASACWSARNPSGPGSRFYATPA